ncbi:uncharacterized protein LY89DRAFT_694905 [Mollisia scopiformis]|uniref:Uncharacterized protein n=1 Tax=Mollisia scopiformis TaxID=149040 RepID=A0A194XMS5_MOLSC|nr:uncharacterized protein LY89DRAFT_694905 [Mollisia scopiformis]KUJ21458.1 hypothetical protein LY89DRAFT_694905 [Mollisia scopiformis]
MSIKQAAWTHGIGLELETPTWTALRQGFYTTAKSAMIRFSTGPTAKITSIHVYDGEKKIADYNGLSLTGNLQFVLWGTAVCVAVQFNGTAASDYVQFIGSGIDFYV